MSWHTWMFPIPIPKYIKKGSEVVPKCWVNRIFESSFRTLAFFSFTSCFEAFSVSQPFFSSPPHLLTEGAVAALSPPVQLKRLPQQRVERLACAVDGGRVRGHGEGGNVAHLFQWTLALGGLIQQLVVLEVLWQPLQHGNGLVEVDLQRHGLWINWNMSDVRYKLSISWFNIGVKVWCVWVVLDCNSAVSTHRHRDLGQLFADTVLHDTPQVQRVIGFVWNACSPLLQGHQLLWRRLLVHC